MLYELITDHSARSAFDAHFRGLLHQKATLLSKNANQLFVPAKLASREAESDWQRPHVLQNPDLGGATERDVHRADLFAGEHLSHVHDSYNFV